MLSIAIVAPVVGALAVALVIDLVVGEPPRRLHPVAWFGSAVGPFDREWSRPRLVGACVAVGLPGVAAIVAGSVLIGTAIGAAVVSGSGAVVAGGASDAGSAGGAGVAVASVIAGVILSVTVSLRMLLGVTTDVVGHTA